MKRTNLLWTLAMGATILTSCNCSAVKDTTAKLHNEADTACFYIGYMYGTGILRSGLKEPNMKAIMAGMNSAIQKKEIGVEQMEMSMYINTFIQKMLTKVAEENLEKGQKFLEENLKRSAVDTLSDGIQYEVIKAGGGERPTATDRVKVNYVGTLIDGTEFDSSIKRGEPAEFGLNQVIPGWTKAIQAMPVGSKWKIYIPSEQAYGQRGGGAVIGPNETLIFEVELLEIVKPESQEAK